ncbi:hypothetical protein QYE76_024806 [Lolium multiflorum]|uniref:Uncharacterized protein n=1 Tax=Lolium multiflorum TaxID=4521 RepID=A0AAD8RGT5_LOLMU|nr:hypothetical protein QYE76_024806 [Lolium multiflorum]
MGSSDPKAAGGAVGGKSARACDGCMRRRARWYCAADDAFLCQSCDTSVHSANPLARRHERLRLRATSASPPTADCVAEVTTTTTISSSKRLRVAPAWLKRKARTRRPPVKSVGQLLSRRLVVPQVSAGESSDERRATEEEQLLYRVPVFDPALGDFCSPLPIDDAAATTSGSCRDNVDGAVEQTKEPIVAPSPVQELPDCFASFGPTDAELSEFAADMEALLGQGLEESSELGDSFYMEALGLISPAGDGGQIKVEADGGLVCRSNGVLASGPGMKPDFNGSPPTLVDDDDSFEHKTSSASNCGDAVDDAQFLKRSLDLRLNYEAVIDSWESSPWTDGRRPHGQLDDLLLYDHSGMWTAGGGGRQGEAAWTPRPKADGWREARVSRYREKRRTRLFAKKIRYEVRKLNAEKRPRMKGRFVKRSGAAAAAPCAVT